MAEKSQHPLPVWMEVLLAKCTSFEPTGDFDPDKDLEVCILEDPFTKNICMVRDYLSSESERLTEEHDQYHCVHKKIDLEVCKRHAEEMRQLARLHEAFDAMFWASLGEVSNLRGTSIGIRKGWKVVKPKDGDSWEQPTRRERMGIMIIGG